MTPDEALKILALKEDRKIDDFLNHYFTVDATGTIEGGDGTPVHLVMIAQVKNIWEPGRAEYGVPQGSTEGIACSWIPAGMTYDRSDPNTLPKEAGVDPKLIQPESEWIEFPRFFNGVPVYYKRGAQAFAG